MTATDADAPLEIDITDVTTSFAQRTSGIDYRVRNTGNREIWIVDDPWFVWHQDKDGITISFARGRMRDDVEPFGYFLPEVTPLAPQTGRDRRLDLNWPVRLSTIWNEECSVWPPAGHYRVALELGFGFSPQPSTSDDGDVEQDVLAWQHRTASRPADLEVPHDG